MKDSLAKKGVMQGDMSPKVEDYQRPDSNFPEKGFSKTLDYIDRQDKFVGKESSKIKGQHYEGRYS